MNHSKTSYPGWIGGLLGVALALLVFSAMGVPGAVADMWKYSQEGPPPEATLEDYEAVESIAAVDGTVIQVRLSEDPRFAAYGSIGQSKINQLVLTSSDGRINERVELQPGQRTVLFDANGERQLSGDYTLALVHYEPADPGLFGHGERESSQLIEFTVSDGEVEVTKVPQQAASYEEDLEESL